MSGYYVGRGSRVVRFRVAGVHPPFFCFLVCFLPSGDPFLTWCGEFGIVGPDGDG